MRKLVGRHWTPSVRRFLLFDVGVAVLCGLLSLFMTISVDNVSPHMIWLIPLTAVLVLRRKFPVTLLVLMAAVEFWVRVDMFPILMCAAYTAAAYGRRVAAILAMVFASTMMLISIHRAVADQPGPILWAYPYNWAFNLGLPALAGLYARGSQTLLTESRARVKAVEQQRQLVAERAVLEERTRIARDMHDHLGHKLSLVVLHAGALELRGGQDADRAGLIRLVGHEAMQDLRKIIGVLNAQDDVVAPCATLTAEVERLVGASREAGVPLEYTVDADLDGLDAQVGDAVRRVVREALTNLHKHAGAVPASLHVRAGDGQLHVRIANDRPAITPETHQLGSGSGLVELAKRIDALGGRLRHGPTADGGFLVDASLPAHPRTAGMEPQ